MTTYTIHSAHAHREGLTLQEAADAMLLTREDIEWGIEEYGIVSVGDFDGEQGGAHDMLCVEDGTDIDEAIADCNANDKRGEPIIL